MEVRTAEPGEATAARGILDAAMLAVEEGALRRGTTLVAVEEGRLLGALVLDGEAVHAVAVRPGRRDQGVGTALVDAAADRRARLTAGFDPGVRPFYEALGFEVTCDGGRCRGVLDA
ncbi:GNAT family N-acetyltransferase [Natronomonas marina]|jgi:GNAT superfamily N-acetyltransferase|uniref:GNAT family N-acetyltransferase n=1 Tax=Natronomonas marina TaxID=2961939 RepID=UPI0020C95774|nr:GNAT family N-acetyltransferase [Natronomonas marina]